MEYGNQFAVTKSFYDWCVENNRMDLNDRFDAEKNGCTTKEVGYKSNLKWWFKCPRGLHDGDQYFMYFVSNNPSRDLVCRKCNSVAQVVIDRFGEDYLWSHWHDSNTLSPWDIPSGSGSIYAKIQCDKKDYHVYDQVASSFVDGIGCPYCINRKVHPNDSLGTLFPEVINRWSSKNNKTPYEYSPHTDKKAWFTCPNDIHDDYLQRINNAQTYGFTCRKCETARWGIEHRGENSSSWRGGVSEEWKVQRKRREYVEWRTLVYERDNYTCQCCGARGGRLNAHHLNSFASYPELRLNVDNGITLCAQCHDATEPDSLHNMYGTHNILPDILRKYILDKTGKDIYITNPNLLYQVPSLPNDEFEFD